MARRTKATSLLAAAGICSFASILGLAALSDPLPPDTTYRPLPSCINGTADGWLHSVPRSCRSLRT
jgi:hypothetical protein